MHWAGLISSLRDEAQDDARSVSAQDRELSQAIDAVHFDVWARGFLELDRVQATSRIYLSIIVGTLSDIASLPIAMARLAPAAILAITVSGLSLWAFGVEVSATSVLALGTAILTLNRFSAAEFHLISLLWNLGDLVSAGRITRWNVKRYWRFFRRPKLGDRANRRAWVFISRSVACSDAMEKEREALSEFSVKASDDPDHAWAAIRAYWRDHHDARDYWRTLLSLDRRQSVSDGIR